jgi:pSer/pThr/pTyr-binding forkhead associated (FHA) protein
MVRTFDGPMVTIGSDDACTLCLNDSALAPEQALLIAEKNRWLLFNKADGTALNDEPLAREARRSLSDGDELRVGTHIISFALSEGGADGHGAPAAEDAPRPDTPGGRAAPPTQASPPQNPTHETETPRRNFAEILESLRTIEDSFYFEVEGGAQPSRRVTIEAAVMPLGWDTTGRNISFETATIATPCAVVRKDWSGVFLQPLGAGAVTVNGERVEAERRLRDGDRLLLTSRGTGGPARGPDLIFHEPATLEALNSLYRQSAPAALDAPAEESKAGDDQETPAPSPKDARRPRLFDPSRKFFGHFTLLELAFMCVATLAAAVVVFLVLIYLMPTR